MWLGVNDSIIFPPSESTGWWSGLLDTENKASAETLKFLRIILYNKEKDF
jgi:hypothetical protein